VNRQARCTRNIWAYLKFENQLAHYARLPYKLSSCSMMRGATAHTEQIPCKLAWQCFQVDSFLISGISPGPSICLILQYWTTSFGAMSKARYNICILLLLVTYNSEFGFVQWILKEMLRVLTPFHHDGRSVLNDMVVTYEVSYSNSNDYCEFLQEWNIFTNVDKVLPLCLKVLFYFKNHQAFLAHSEFCSKC
jgi:hypothetical protein